LAPLLLLGIAACGEEEAPSSTDSTTDESSNVDMGDEIPGVKVTGEVGEAPKVDIDPPLEIDATQTQVIEAGDGNPVVEGEQVLLNLYLGNATTGDEVASTYEQGAPFHVQQASEGQLWPGVLEAIIDKPVGSRVAVAAVPQDAYGEAGNPELKIGKDDPVLFVVDIMSVQPTEVVDGADGDGAGDIPEDIPTIEEEGGAVTNIDFANAPAKPSSELQVIPLTEGEGPPARDGSLVTFDYFGQVYDTETVFDESFSKEPVTFPLGIGGLIKGWDEGLVGLNRGSRVLIIAPPEFAYGAQGSPPKIPGDATLAFVVDILGVDEPS